MYSYVIPMTVRPTCASTLYIKIIKTHKTHIFTYQVVEYISAFALACRTRRWATWRATTGRSWSSGTRCQLAPARASAGRSRPSSCQRSRSPEVSVPVCPFHPSPWLCRDQTLQVRERERHTIHIVTGGGCCDSEKKTLKRFRLLSLRGSSTFSSVWQFKYQKLTPNAIVITVIVYTQRCAWFTTGTTCKNTHTLFKIPSKIIVVVESALTFMSVRHHDTRHQLLLTVRTERISQYNLVFR